MWEFGSFVSIGRGIVRKHRGIWEAIEKTHCVVGGGKHSHMRLLFSAMKILSKIREVISRLGYGTESCLAFDPS